MSDEVEEVIEVETAEESSEEIKALAREEGWTEDFRGDEGREFIGAKEFLRRGVQIRKSLKTKLDSQARELADIKRAITGLNTHNEKLRKVEIEKLREELEAKKEAAIEESDVAGVRKIEKELLRIEEAEETVDEALPSGPDPAYTGWHGENSWYQKDRVMTAFADAEAAKFKGANEWASLAEVLEHVSAEVAKEFPGRKRSGATPPSPEGGSAKNGGAKSRYTRADLSPDQRQFMDNCIKSGAGITEAKWIADLVKIGELK